jgi:predicted DNA-binding protein (UPF0251 family)
MGRNCIRRHVRGVPAVKGLRPFGRLDGQRPSIVLSLDEYEAIRLLDHENLTQDEASKMMQVSRPTLTRIYDRARKKYATALVEGGILLVEGGEVTLQEHLFICEDCGELSKSSNGEHSQCPRCQSSRVRSLDDCYQNRCKQCRKCHQGGGNAKQ